MDTPNQPGSPSEQPATQPIVNAQPGEQSAATFDAHTAAMEMDSDSLRALLDGNAPPTPEPAEPAAPESPGQPDPLPASEQPAPVEPVEPLEPDPGDSAQKLLKRVSVRGIPADQQELTAKAIQLVRDGAAADMPAAIFQLTGTQPITAPAADPAAEQPEAIQPPQNDELDTLEQQWEQLHEEWATAKRAFEVDDEIRLQKEIHVLSGKITDTRQAQATRAVEAATFEQAYETATNAMEAEYADILDDPQNPFAEILDAKIIAARATNDPITKHPDYVRRIADKLAAQLGIAQGGAQPPAAAPATVRPNQPPSPAPVRAARPVGSALTPGHNQEPRMTREETLKLVTDAPSDVLLALLEG